MQTSDNFDNGADCGVEAMTPLEGGGKKLSLAKGESFLTYMSTITEQDKANLMNIGHYVIHAIIPVTIFLKLMTHFAQIRTQPRDLLSFLLKSSSSFSSFFLHFISFIR